jgi:hypothetical protein
MKTCDIISDEAQAVSRPPEPGHTPGAALAEFWERRGCPVIESGGVFWRRFKGPVYAPLPCHLQLDPQAGEMEEVLRRGKVAAVRFPVRGPGIPAGLYVVRPSGYTLGSVNRKQRGHVKTGLERCEIRRVEQDELREAGIALNRDTMGRQGRHDPEFADPRSWARVVRAVYACPAFEVTGAYVDARLAAYLISYREGPWLHLLYKTSRTADLAHYPNHALDFAVLRRAAEDPSIEAIENGLRPLDNPGLDQYKRQMGYEVTPHPLAVQFHPAASPAIANHAVLGAVNALRAVFPRSPLNLAAQVLEVAIARRTAGRDRGVPQPVGAAARHAVAVTGHWRDA